MTILITLNQQQHPHSETQLFDTPNDDSMDDIYDTFDNLQKYQEIRKQSGSDLNAR